MRIAYFINQYPAASHTFIRREIRAVEALGETIFRYSLRSEDNLVEPEDKDEQKSTRYIQSAGIATFLRSFLHVFSRTPVAFCKAVALAITIGRRSDRGILRHFAYLLEAAVLATWCAKDRIEHIHAHFGTNSAAIAMLAWRISGVPFSFTVHGPEEFDKAPLIGLAEKLRHCRFAVAISSYGRSQLYRLVERKYWEKIKVVHCGVRPNLFEVVGTNLPTHSRRFVCIGRFSEQKGHLLLIEACSQLAKRGEKFELLLCGDGKLRYAIEALIEHYSLRNDVKILGWVDDARVRQELLAARALVLPSLAEGLPVAIMEAMALGRPVISTYIAGIPELVTPEVGWLVPAGDICELADAMQKCLCIDDTAIARMGIEGRNRARSRHDISTEASKLIALFKAYQRR
jgi:colanic acid/amylovoran biosynthesis glycosyltransferase